MTSKEEYTEIGKRLLEKWKHLITDEQIKAANELGYAILVEPELYRKGTLEEDDE